MASAAGTSSVALLFALSAVVFLFLLLQAQRPGLAVSDLLLSALDRFLDGRGLLLELATRRNMILLCHAILFLILWDAGVLGKPARRCHSRTPPGEATVAFVVAQTTAPAPARPHTTRSAVVAQAACSAVPVPARPHATRSAVVWRRRPRSRAAVAMHDATAAACRLVECQPAAEAAATWAAPVLGPLQAAEEAAAVATKQIVLVESPRNDDDGLLDLHDRARAAVVEPVEHPTAIAADGERGDCDDRQIVAVADDDDEKRTDDQTAGMETQMEMELADDRTFEEFIKSQRRKMRQESL